MNNISFNKVFLFCFCVLFLIALQAHAQVASDCSISASFRSHYEDDAKYLAVKYLYDTGSPDTAFIGIPQKYVDSVLSRMSAIFHTGSQIEADSVFDIFCGHHYQSDFGTPIMLIIDPHESWTQAWKNGQTQTGVVALDQLLASYGFSLTNYHYFQGSATAQLHSSQIVNGKALLGSLKLFSGIYDGVQQNVGGDGDEIYYSAGAVQEFTFSRKWGDCMSGCINAEN